MMGDDFDIHSLGFNPALAEFLTTLDTVVHSPLDVSLQAFAKVLEHGWTTTEHDVLVKTTASIDGAALHSIIHHLRQRSQEVAAEDFGIEEHFGTQEAFIAHINNIWCFGYRLDTLESLEPFWRLGIVLLVFLHNIWAHVAEGFLDSFGGLQGFGGGNLFTTLTEQLLHKRGDVSTSQRDVFDAAANDITLSLETKEDEEIRINHYKPELLFFVFVSTVLHIPQE